MNLYTKVILIVFFSTSYLSNFCSDFYDFCRNLNMNNMNDFDVKTEFTHNKNVLF